MTYNAIITNVNFNGDLVCNVHLSGSPVVWLETVLFYCVLSHNVNITCIDLTAVRWPYVMIDSKYCVTTATILSVPWLLQRTVGRHHEGSFSNRSNLK